MKGKNNWEYICEKVQQRSLESTTLTVKSARELRAQILKCLTEASNDGILINKLHEIHSLLKYEESTKHGNKIKAVTGGQLNFKRRRELPHFERYDHSWFDFGILVDETDKPAKIIGFHFEIRFLDDNPIKFLRFDLNLPEHHNQERGMRFHLHPGSDDLMLHSPPMSPLEILHLFLYGLPVPKNPRAS